MAPPEPPSEITVRVKVPQGHLESTSRDEFQLGTISTSQPISTLRQRINTLVPSNPAPHNQRLLFGGRALIDDAQTLADAFNTRRDPGQTEYVVHLLIRNGGTLPTRHGNATDTVHNGQGSLGAATRVESTNLAGQPVSASIGSGGAAPTLPPGLQQGLFAGLSHVQAGQTAGPAPMDGTAPSVQSTTPGTQPAANGQPTALHHHHHHHGPHHHIQHAHGHAHPNPFTRPLSAGFHVAGTGPDGQRFTYTTQTFVNGNLQHVQAHPQGAPMPAPSPMHYPLPMPFPGMTQAPQAPNVPMASALDRARENMAEMRRMIETMRSENATEETRSQIANLEQRMRAVNDYIDPFGVGARQPRPTTPNAQPNVPQSAPQSEQDPQRRLYPLMSGPLPTLPVPGHAHQGPPPGLFNPSASGPAPSGNSPLPIPPGGEAVFGRATPGQNLFGAPPVNNLFGPAALGGFPNPLAQLLPLPNLHLPQLRPQPAMQPASTEQTEVYLLSSPQGPNALLFSPQHGTYTGTALHPTAAVVQNVTPTATQPVQPQGEVVAAAVPAVPQAPAEAQGALQPWLGHLWLLFRIMIFAYLLLGVDMGWRRPVALGLIGLGFWLIRLGLFGDGGLVRRWWDGVVHVQVRQPGDPAQAQGQPAGVAGQRPLPTPEELAQRLVREQRERTPLHRLREQIRPAERVLALFVASLWPGIGERYVQALDRAREEEEAARRAVEAERVNAAARLAEEAEKQRLDAEASMQAPGEKQSVDAEASTHAGDVKVVSEQVEIDQHPIDGETIAEASQLGST